VIIHQNSSNCLLVCTVGGYNCHPKCDTFVYAAFSPREPEGDRLNYDTVESRLLEVRRFHM